MHFMGKSGLPGTQKGAFAEIISERGGFDNKFFWTFTRHYGAGKGFPEIA